MREIKFRAWDKKNKKMYYENTETDFIKQLSFDGSICFYEDDDGGKNGFHEHHSLYYDLEKECSLMQYTGLKDKNGKEIYEDDLIRDIDLPQRVYKVTWSEKTSRWSKVTQSGDGFWYDLFDGGKDIPDYFEVIGNIYENPDLTSKKEDNE